MAGAPLNDAAADEPFSICEELAGATVLLTGATGYVGSLVLELLLRQTQVGGVGWGEAACWPPWPAPPKRGWLAPPQVKRVYALIRGKQGAGAQERLQTLLAGARLAWEGGPAALTPPRPRPQLPPPRPPSQARCSTGCAASRAPWRARRRWRATSARRAWGWRRQRPPGWRAR
jgi:hypothetical protein